MSYRPQMATKIRSKPLMQAIGGRLPRGMRCEPMPCTLRIATFVAGQTCAGYDTVCGDHTGNTGKGMSTKVSDISAVAGCLTCHDMLDRRAWPELWATHEVHILRRIIAARDETLAMLIDRGIIKVIGAKII